MDEEKTKDYKEEFEKIDEEEIDEPFEEETEEYDEEIETREERNKDKVLDEKKLQKRRLLIILTIILFIMAMLILLFYIIRNKKENNSNIDDKTIARPEETIDYTAIKQSYFNLKCDKASDGSKYKKLIKGLVIDCSFEFDSNQKVKELYFDLEHSANVKVKNTKNTSDYKMANNEKLYKLTTNNPQNVVTDKIHFYLEVLNDIDETGYIEVTNIVFKDENDKYYKVTHSIETFPPEYDDKLYIYKASYEEEDERVYYYSSKVKYTDDELYDTFQCTNETCSVKAENNKYFLIYDDKLLVYNTVKKTSSTIKVPEDFKVDDYTYEIMLNVKDNILGVAFKKNYVSEYDCKSNQYVCINKGLSGYEIAYYSMALDNFSIALDYGFVGSSVYTDHDVAMMLKKDNKFGIFSFEDDNMMLEMTDKYTAMDFDDETNSIIMEVYDEENKEYYFEYFNPTYASITIDTDNLTKYEDSTLYYAVAFNRNGTSVTMLFNDKGNQLTKLPYVKSDQIISVTDTIVTKDELYRIYDLKGNPLYVTQYNPKKVLAHTKSYVVAENDDKLVLDDNKGNLLVNIKDLDEGIQFISASEKEEGILTLIVKDASITEENKNAYKYTIEVNKPFVVETIYVE